MADPARNLRERLTYGDYRKWPDDERWELIEGVAYSMRPAPMRPLPEARRQGVLGVDLLGQWLCVYRLGPEGKFDAGDLRELFRDSDPVRSRVLKGFVIEPAVLFAEE